MCYSITYQGGKPQEQVATGPITPHSSPLPTHLTQTFQKVDGGIKSCMRT
jgi:hypothetical protein